jgi:short-subunit dehydrogenase
MPDSPTEADSPTGGPAAARAPRGTATSAQGLHVPRIVVVTGASAGLGRAIAHAFAAEGADVALLARDANALEAAANEVRAHGVRALPIPVDVSDAAAVEAAAERVETELGPIDTWVNNAMLTIFSPLSSVTPEEYERVTAVTYLGYVYGTMAALRRMTARDHGVIVQVGSALAYRAIPLQSAYCGAKHGVRGFTDALRSELLHDRSRVHVTMVQMPALNTPQFDWAACRMPHAPRPVAPIYQPEVGARAVVWAARHRRRELFVGVSSIVAIVANKFFPGLIDRYLARTNYRAQQRQQAAGADRPDNLWQPVNELHSTRGAFNAESTERSTALWLSTHRTAVLGGALLVAGLLWSAASRPAGRQRTARR